ncbi:uncharacterized protein LOC121872516 [Homarus americanus]|uniref:uncharacterized protein LOC121872516 n=1 Tax=Homarus americanus TaxID=6706 RepID=UPI001C480D19|nr:uncharacterized protein LOC121872516 [Homarus americanus]
MFALRNTTRSLSVRRNLDEVVCYMDGTTLPPRLADDETVTPAYETTTLGIGPMMRLLALHESELPDPMMRWMQTADPDCDEEEAAQVDTVSEDKQDKRRDHGHNNGRKRANQKNKAQNDMAPVEAQPNSDLESTAADAEPPAPVQEESRAYDSGAKTTEATIVPLVALCLILLHARPH